MWVISDLELNLTIYCKGQTVLESVLVLGLILYPLNQKWLIGGPCPYFSDR